MTEDHFTLLFLVMIICSEVLTRMLRKEVDELKEKNNHISTKLLELESKLKERENEHEICRNQLEKRRKRELDHMFWVFCCYYFFWFYFWFF